MRVIPGRPSAEKAGCGVRVGGEYSTFTYKGTFICRCTLFRRGARHRALGVLRPKGWSGTKAIALRVVWQTTPHGRRAQHRQTQGAPYRPCRRRAPIRVRAQRAESRRTTGTSSFPPNPLGFYRLASHRVPAALEPPAGDGIHRLRRANAQAAANRDAPLAPPIDVHPVWLRLYDIDCRDPKGIVFPRLHKRWTAPSTFFSSMPSSLAIVATSSRSVRGIALPFDGGVLPSGTSLVLDAIHVTRM